MLVFSRKKGQQSVITVPPSDRPQKIVVDAVEIRGDKVRLGFEAPEEISIHRREVQGAIDRERKEADGPRSTDAA